MALRLVEHRRHVAGETLRARSRNRRPRPRSPECRFRRPSRPPPKRRFSAISPPCARSRSAIRAASASRSASALSRNTSTARAMAPISSLRRPPWIGTAADRRSAIRLIISAMRRSGMAMKMWLKHQGADQSGGGAGGENADGGAIHRGAARRRPRASMPRPSPAEHIDQTIELRGDVVARRIEFADRRCVAPRRGRRRAAHSSARRATPWANSSLPSIRCTSSAVSGA